MMSRKGSQSWVSQSPRDEPSPTSGNKLQPSSSLNGGGVSISRYPWGMSTAPRRSNPRSKAQDPSALRRFTFLELPAELRNAIYEDLFRFDMPLGLNHTFYHPRFRTVATAHVRRVPISLLSTCRQIYHEAHSIFRRNEFTFELSYWRIRRQQTVWRCAEAPWSFFQHIQNLTVHISALHSTILDLQRPLPTLSYKKKHNQEVMKAIDELVLVLMECRPRRLHLAIRVAAPNDNEVWNEGMDYEGTLEMFRLVCGIIEPSITFTPCYCKEHHPRTRTVAFAEQLADDMQIDDEFT